MLPGTVVNIPANVKHWHGADANSWFSHLAVECPGEETSTEWLEAVSDGDYQKLEASKKEMLYKNIIMTIVFPVYIFLSSLRFFCAVHINRKLLWDIP